MTNQKNSLSWQLYQLKQRFDEWQELQARKLDENIPDIDLFSWLNNDLVESIARFLFWIIITFIFVLFAFKVTNLLIIYFNKYNNKYSQNKIQKKTKNQEILSVNNWLKKADYFQQKGNYRDAVWCLYMAMLQKLNDQGIASHQLSRTDGEYLQIIQTLPNFSPYQILLINHQKLLFANQEATLNMWEECQKAFQEINLNLSNK